MDEAFLPDKKQLNDENNDEENSSGQEENIFQSDEVNDILTVTLSELSEVKLIRRVWNNRAWKMSFLWREDQITLSLLLIEEGFFRWTTVSMELYFP